MCNLVDEINFISFESKAYSSKLDDGKKFLL